MLVSGIVLTVGWMARPSVVTAGSTHVLVNGSSLNWFGTTYSARPGVMGQLSRNERGCLVLLDPAGRERFLLIWPHGTEVSGSDAEVVLTHGGRTVRVGEEMDTITGATSDTLDDYFADRVPQACQALTPLLIEEF